MSGSGDVQAERMSQEINSAVAAHDEEPSFRKQLVPCANIDEWLAARKTGIGSSDSPILMGCGFAGSSPFKLGCLKLGKIQDEESSEVMECGHVLQPGICELLRRRTKYNIVDAGPWDVYRHQDIDWMLASPDSLIFGDPRGLGIAELKNVGQYNAHEWKSGEDPPLRVNVQIQHQLFVLNATWGITCGLVGGNRLVWHEVERDDRFIEYALLPNLERFWESISQGVLPEIDGSDATCEVIKLLHPKDNGSTIELPAEADLWDAELQAVKAELKLLDERKKQLENCLTLAIQDASFAVTPAGQKYSYKWQHRNGFTVEPSEFRVLRTAKG